MTAHHRHPLDRLRADPPPEAPDWSSVELEIDGEDLLNWLQPVLLCTGDGHLRGVRFGRVTWTNEDLLKAIGSEGFSRFERISADELRRPLDDWIAARIEEKGDAE